MTVAVKVCGITRRDDALLAAALGASRIGLVFWPHSPRCVDEATARAIVDTLPDRVGAVGVFVNASPAEVRQMARRVGLAAVQLHGDENLEEYRDVGAHVIKTVPIGTTFDRAALASIPLEVTVLLDAHDPARRGGTGRTIDWTIAAEIASERPVILSGGLNADNLAAAIARVRPQMVDVSSGVERTPGVKDPDKLRAFFACLQ